MFINYFSFFIAINFLFGDVNLYSHDNENSLACPGNKVCISVDYCSEIVTSLNEATLPIHRFRQAICGYIGKNPKVCCNTQRDTGNFIPDNNPRPVEPPQECGRSLVKSSISTLGSYPFLARIGFINLNDGKLKYPCTGVIINERTILTTATCALATANNYKLHSVLVGEFDSAENPDCNELFCAHCTRSHNISYIVKHPNFQHELYYYNIALIRLAESITFTLTTQPICYCDQQYIFTGNRLMLVGWGKLSMNRDSSEQQAFFMNVLNKQDCNDFVEHGLSVELCASGRQVCSGFSGSPLINYDGRRYTVVGLLSYGTNCNSNNNPLSVFVDIQRYIEWISENS